MPGGFPQTPGVENPYKASHPLDPRVDGGRVGDVQPSTSSYSSSPAATSSGAAGIGSGSALGAASHASKNTQESSVPAPSSLTSTANPTDRSAEYSKSTELRGLDTDPPQDQGILNKALGAVGLGGAASAAAAALGLGPKKEGSDDLHDSSAIASIPGQVSSESGPPKHYRRESIPTTAYPAGPNSPRAVAPPIGGSSTTSQAQQPRDTIIGGQSSSVPATSGPGLGSATSGVSDTQHRDNAPVRDSSAPVSTFHDQATIPTEESHNTRNIAAAGVGAGALGAGAYALHDSNKTEPATTTLPDRTRDTAIPASGSAPAPALAATPIAGTGHPASSNTAPIVPASGAAPAPALAATPIASDTTHSTSAHQTPATTSTSTPIKTEDDHTGRNAALGAGAGAAAIGGTAYAVDHHREEEARKAAAEHEKELAKQREARAKEAEKAEKQQQKELEKEEKKAEKEEKKHQKEIEKEEKKHQKELEKEEKKHEKEEKKHEKEEKKHQKELEEQAEHHRKEEADRQAALLAAQRREEEENKHRGLATAGIATGTAVGSGMAIHGLEQDEEYRRKEAADRERALQSVKDREGHGTAAGVGAGTALGSGAAVAHERSSVDKSRTSLDSRPSKTEKEKKPNIFKRIFKRRKNKDTGEDEDYSTDDEEDKARHAAGATGVAVGSGVGAGAGYALHEDDKHSRVPHHESETKGRNVLGRAPERTSIDIPREPTTGLVYDPSKDPAAAQRLSEKAALSQAIGSEAFRTEGPAGTTTEHSAIGHPAGGNSAFKTEDPFHTSTGSPAIGGDRSATGGALGMTAASGTTTGATTGTTAGLGSDARHDHEGVIDTPAGGHIPVTATEPFGEITDHRR